jgi:hypothetical protein
MTDNDLGNAIIEQISWNIPSSATLKTLILDSEIDSFLAFYLTISVSIPHSSAF